MSLEEEVNDDASCDVPGLVDGKSRPCASTNRKKKYKKSINQSINPFMKTWQGPFPPLPPQHHRDTSNNHLTSSLAFFPSLVQHSTPPLLMVAMFGWLRCWFEVRIGVVFCFWFGFSCFLGTGNFARQHAAAKLGKMFDLLFQMTPLRQAYKHTRTQAYKQASKQAVYFEHKWLSLHQSKKRY